MELPTHNYKLDARGPQEMPLSSIRISREVAAWLNTYFADTIKRNALSGDMYAMLREAYVLGMHHSQVAQQAEKEPTQ